MNQFEIPNEHINDLRKSLENVARIGRDQGVEKLAVQLKRLEDFLEKIGSKLEPDDLVALSDYGSTLAALFPQTESLPNSQAIMSERQKMGDAYTAAYQRINHLTLKGPLLSEMFKTLRALVDNFEGYAEAREFGEKLKNIADRTMQELANNRATQSVPETKPQGKRSGALSHLTRITQQFLGGGR